MPQWDKKQFDEKATDIAHAYHAGRGTLHDLTVKLAKDKTLNEEQIRRLGRAVNVKAFEQKFASLKGKSDRIVEFETVNPENVVDELFRSSPAAEKTAEAIYPDLPDQMRQVRGWGGQTKTAAVDVDAEIQKILPKDPPLESQLNHWRKVADELNVKLAGAEINWDSAMDTLIQHGRRLYWDRDEFEKNAFALFGESAILELNALRADRHIDPLDIKPETAEKLASQLFGEETEDAKLLKLAIDSRLAYVQISRAVTAAQAKVAGLKKRLLP